MTGPSILNYHPQYVIYPSQKRLKSFLPKYIYSLFSFQYSRNYHNIGKQLYSNNINLKYTSLFKFKNISDVYSINNYPKFKTKPIKLIPWRSFHYEVIKCYVNERQCYHHFYNYWYILRKEYFVDIKYSYYRALE